jgi:glycosyltransferase involved in cell wall biosynthesis
MRNPILTVAMPTYNAEKHIGEAINSVLNQTFEDFELLIINDGSLDHTLEIISSYRDTRIRLIDLEKNKGIAHCRNLALQEARGEFIAWTDSDDLNEPTRFEKQIYFLQHNPDFGGCGTWLSRFKDSKTHYVTKAYSNPEKIRAALLFKPASIPNATAMLRLAEIRKYGLRYDESLKISEDYDFIFNCSRHLKFSNIQEILYRYRDSETSIMKTFEDQEEQTFNILKTVYKKALASLDIIATEEQLRLHHDICSSKILSKFSEYETCYYWLESLKLKNDLKREYNKKVFNYIITEQFFFLSKKASSFGLKTLWFFVRKSLKNKWIINPKDYSKLAIRCALRYDKFEFKLT